MSQTKTFTCTHSTVVKVKDDGSSGQGCGGNSRLYAGRSPEASGTRRQYKSYLLFGYDWSGVGSIVKAELILYSDDGQGGTFPLPSTTDDPYVVAKRLLAAFTEGNNTDEHFDSTDYTNPGTPTASGAKGTHMQKAANLVTVVDVTAIVKAHAPATVSGGGKQHNHGIGLYGNTSSKQGWSGWSRHASAPYRPTIVLTYNEGPTTPYAPTDMAPTGAVASIGAFQGDFTDPRPTDTLGRTEIQVYTSSAVKTGGTAGTDDIIHLTSHGYTNGQEVWFHSLTGGAGLSVGTRYFVRNRTTSTFKVCTVPNGAVVNITDAYSDLHVAAPLWVIAKTASNTEVINQRFNVVPDGLHLVRGTTYTWRARYVDQEARWSAWSSLLSFSVTNTDPDAPTITPADESVDDLGGVVFRGGTFVDADAGDTLSAFQVQMSAYPAGNANWDDADFILWDTGKRYVAADADAWETLYSGTELDAGLYYVRARQWDNHDGVSDWAYTTITLLNDFNPEPGTQTTSQIDIHAPWRLIVKEMKFNAVGGALTGNATTDQFTTASNHGLTLNQRVRFGSLTGGTGLFVGPDYWIISSGLGAKTFKVATSEGGSAVNFSTNVTAGSITAVTTRGPGNTVAIFEHAKSVGASIVYNSPGEMHFTLTPDDPQISVVEPKQTHYAIYFYGADGWRETFAGLVDDFDATETSVVFTGIDYLGLLDRTMDERYFPSDPNRSYAKGGSYYSNQSIYTVVVDQLTRVTRVANSPVGFIAVGTIAATMTSKVSIYSTMQPVLAFVAGLLDSHRQGTGKKTRLQVRRTSTGGYEFVVQDNPGVQRDNLRLRYGEMVQGYRAIPFGPNWASVLNSIGRTRDGIRVLYKTRAAPGIDPKVWGRFARAVIMDNVSDELDLDRRTRQAALHGGKLGQSIGLAVRSGVLRPLDGYDICDEFPVSINHGAVNTANWGSGYWVCYGIAWEAGDDASQNVSLTLLPRDDSIGPSDDLIDARPISPQAEWQVGWTPPDPLKATSKYWLDQSTGIVYIRDDETNTLHAITGTV